MTKRAAAAARLSWRLNADLPLDFRARVSVTDVVERIEPPARNAGLWSVRGARLPRDQQERIMTEQITGALSTAPATSTSAKPAGKSKTETLRKPPARRTGATVVQIQKQLDWQPHTIRAAISRLRSSGVPVELDRSGRVARYRIMPEKRQ